MPNKSTKSEDKKTTRNASLLFALASCFIVVGKNCRSYLQQLAITPDQELWDTYYTNSFNLISCWQEVDCPAFLWRRKNTVLMKEARKKNMRPGIIEWRCSGSGTGRGLIQWGGTRGLGELLPSWIHSDYVRHKTANEHLHQWIREGERDLPWQNQGGIVPPLAREWSVDFTLLFTVTIIPYHTIPYYVVPSAEP